MSKQYRLIAFTEMSEPIEPVISRLDKAAGTGLRGAMQDAKVAASEIRKEVTEKKNAK